MLLGFSSPAESQTPRPLNTLTGVWKLNLSKSTYPAGPPPYKRSTCTIEQLGDGLKVTYDMVGLRGALTHMEWVGKPDGQDYPIQGVDDVLTNAYTQIDARTFEVVVKADGTKVATARIVVSPDGRTLMSSTSTRNIKGEIVKTTAVYDKQ